MKVHFSKSGYRNFQFRSKIRVREIMLPFLLAFLFSISLSKSPIQFISAPNKKNLQTEIDMTKDSHATISDITGGSVIIIHLNNNYIYRAFASVYIPDQSITSLFIDGSQVSFTPRNLNYEMFSFDDGSTIEFRFASKTGGSSYGAAEILVSYHEYCPLNSVVEFGGLNKQVYLNLPSTIFKDSGGYYDICLFSPRFSLVSGNDNVNFGSTYSSCSYYKLELSTTLFQIDNFTYSVKNYDPTVNVRSNQSAMYQYSLTSISSATIEGAKTILNRKVLSTSDESFYKNNCVAMTFQICNTAYQVCTASSNVDISYQCDEQPSTNPTPTFIPTNPDPDSGADDKSGSNNMGLIIGIVVGVVVVIVVIIVGIVCYRRKKKSVNVISQKSLLQTDSMG